MLTLYTLLHYLGIRAGKGINFGIIKRLATEVIRLVTSSLSVISTAVNEFSTAEELVFKIFPIHWL